jgi:Trp operon repressor
LYLAVKMDMVRSRKLKERAKVQERFLKVINELNEKFSSSLAARFVVTHGDEAQGLLKAAHAGSLFSIIEYLIYSMPFIHFRFGIGIGTLSTRLQDIAIGMDGEVWQRAKQAIEEVHKSKQFIKFCGFEEFDQQMLGALGDLLLWTMWKWSEDQKTAIHLLRKGMSQVEIAHTLGVSEAAISKRLTAAGWRYYEAGAEAMKALLLKAVKPYMEE